MGKRRPRENSHDRLPLADRPLLALRRETREETETRQAQETERFPWKSEESMTEPEIVAVARRDNHEEPRAIARLLDLAVDKGMSVEGLEKLVALYERVADRQAQQDFADALAAFQSECPPVPKTEKADIVTKAGGRYSYYYAPLQQIAKTVGPFLHKHGLSYTWDSRNVDGKALEVTCRLRHRNGHEEGALFQIPIDNPSAMNDQQKHAAALTYARRQSLIAALGLSTAEPDTDGNDPTAPVSEEQVRRLEEALDGTHLSRARLFKLLGHDLERLEDVPAVLFPTAMNLIMAKRAATQAKAEDG